MDVVPNQTIYVSHIYEKLKKEGMFISDLVYPGPGVSYYLGCCFPVETQKLLYALFGQFGRVVDVVHMKREELRGRAWVVFEDVAGAANALRNLQDFPFFGKPLKLNYAKTKSDAVAKIDGTWRKDGRTRKVRYGQGGDDDASMDVEAQARGGTRTKGPAPSLDIGDPNNTLFVENLPEGTTEAMLKVLFSQFPGYTESRLVQGKPGIAFVDFASTQQAKVAITGLQGFQITPENKIKLTYGKK